MTFLSFFTPLSDCSKLTLLENGYYSTDDVSEGTIVTAECNQNFTLFGNSSLLCLSGGMWNSPSPECRKGTIDTIYEQMFFKILRDLRGEISRDPDY